MPTEYKLVQQINSLLELDAKGALVPHGIGGLARELLTSAAAMLAAAPASPQAAQPVVEVFAPFVKAAECYDDQEDDSHEFWQDAIMHDDLRLNLGQLRALRAFAATHADAGEVERLRLEHETMLVTFSMQEEKIDALHDQLFERDALLTDLGVEPDGVSDVYQRLLLNAERYEYLREHMAVENFPSPHPEWSQPSEYFSRRIDEMCDAALSTIAKPEADHE